MKSLLILFCVVGLIHTVHSSCTSCKPGTTPCDDPYIPSGTEIQACNSVHEDLCKKYGGSYDLGCGSLSNYISCSVTCGAGPITPSIILISIVLAFTIKIVH